MTTSSQREIGNTVRMIEDLGYHVTEGSPSFSGVLGAFLRMYLTEFPDTLASEIRWNAPSAAQRESVLSDGGPLRVVVSFLLYQIVCRCCGLKVLSPRGLQPQSGVNHACWQAY